MRVRWSTTAAEDLSDIVSYIRGDNPEAARRVAKTIYDACESLATIPHRGRKGRIPGTRELILAPLPYIVAYRVGDSAIDLLHVSHGAQDR